VKRSFVVFVVLVFGVGLTAQRGPSPEQQAALRSKVLQHLKSARVQDS